MTRQRWKTPLEGLMRAPWWVSGFVAGTAFVAFRYLFPALATSNLLLAPAAQSLQENAVWIAAMFLLPAPVSLTRAFHRRRLLDRQSGLESMRALSWKDFEMLCGEVFRRKGYKIEETGLGAADGGVNLILRSREERVLVQCERWTTFKVGVQDISELYGILSADPADRAIFVSSGSYTAEARAFAKGKPLELIDGHALLDLVREVQKTPQHTDRVPLPIGTNASRRRPCGPRCPP